MANYRNISINFWTDPKVDDEFTPEDKYFYLYLLTNPHTNICGCYEISMKQMIRETGYNEDTILRLIKRMETTHNVIMYDHDTKEILIINWSKYNWTESDKLKKSVISVSQYIKSRNFQNIINNLLNNKITIKDILQNTVSDTDTDTDVSIGYQYPIDTVSSDSDLKEKNRSIAEYQIAEYTENPDLIQALKDYVKMRRAIKAPNTERAVTLFLNRLNDLSSTDDQKIKVVEQSIERGWKTFYPLKEEKKTEAYTPPTEADYDFSDWYGK